MKLLLLASVSKLKLKKMAVKMCCFFCFVPGNITHAHNIIVFIMELYFRGSSYINFVWSKHFVDSTLCVKVDSTT